MVKTKIYIENCSECKDCQSKRHYTEDSFEMVFDYFCNQNKKPIATLDWNEKMPSVPAWCPRRPMY